MGINGSKQAVSVFLAIIFLSYSTQIFSAETSVNLIGDVVGIGTAEMKTAFDRWVSVSGKSYPLADGANLKTNSGSMSVSMRNGIRMEVGKDSNAKISSSNEISAVTLESGSMGFIIPGKVAFSVATPNVIVHTAINKDNNADTSGQVSYDGKGTKVTTVKGTLILADASGKEIPSVAAGKTVYVSGIGQVAEIVGAATIVVGGTAVVGNTVEKRATKTGDPSPSKP